VLGIDWRL